MSFISGRSIDFLLMEQIQTQTPILFKCLKEKDFKPQNFIFTRRPRKELIVHF